MALLLALEKPCIARTIIVGDFAPFNRPFYMYESPQNLKSGSSMGQARAQLNANRDEVLENAFRRGLPKEAQFEVSREFKDDMSRGWNQGAMTTADAFAHYYSHFTRDQDHFDIVIHNYRWRLGLADGERKYDELERRRAQFPVITVSTITLESDANGAPHPDPSSYASKFAGPYQHRHIEGGIGHNLPQEDPKAFVDAIVDVAGA